MGPQMTNIRATTPAKACHGRRQRWPGSSSRQPSRPSAANTARTAAASIVYRAMIARPETARTAKAPRARTAAATPIGGAAAKKGEAENDPARGADQPRPLQHFAEPARAVEDEVDRPGLAFERFDRFLGAGERVRRVAGRDPVEQRPPQRRRQGQGDKGDEGAPRPDKRRPNQAGVLSIRPSEGHPRRLLGPAPSASLHKAGAKHLEVDCQICEVGEGEEPGLGAEEAGEGEEGEDGPACSRAAGLDHERAEREGDVGEVDVGAEPVREVGRPGEDDERRDGSDRAVEPERAEAVDEVADEAEGDVGDHHRQVDRAIAERGRHEAEQLGQGMRGRGQRGAGVGAHPFRHFAAPEQGVDRVVVGEPEREDQQQERRDGGDPAGRHEQSSRLRFHRRTVPGAVGPQIHWP